MAKRKRTNVQHAQNASVAPPRKAAKPAEQKAENKQGKKQQLQKQTQEQKQKQSTAPAPAPAPATAAPSSKKSTKSHGITSPFSIQVVTGSYERSLHGITATVAPNETGTDFSTQFTDTFLFQAHASAVRCLALSPVPTASSLADTPTPTTTVTLASGGTDERINLYSLSARPPSPTSTLTHAVPLPTLSGNRVIENPKNREIGSLLHHYSTITQLCFPNRSKLLAAADDNTISVTRTRDWSVVSTIKAPRPRSQGRPSGDTAPVGGGPVGVNAFAVHPSMKLMLSVGKGEKAMRLWNLVNGRKAGVLNFKRDVLEAAKEGRYSSGEGRGIVWDTKGSEFAVAFERGVVVFGIESEARAVVVPAPLTKVHAVQYVSFGGEEGSDLLAVSTEDGRVLFYSTSETIPNGNDDDDGDDDAAALPAAKLVAQLAGKDAGQTTRVKAFEVLSLEDNPSTFIVVTCGSDGALRLWKLQRDEIEGARSSKKEETPRVGSLVGTYETNARVTCMVAFMMLPAVEGEGQGEDEERFSEAESEGTAEETSDEEEDEE